MYFFLFPFAMISYLSLPMALLFYPFYFIWSLKNPTFQNFFKFDLLLIIILFLLFTNFAISVKNLESDSWIRLIRYYGAFIFLTLCVAGPAFPVNINKAACSWLLFYFIFCLAAILPGPFSFLYDSGSGRLSFWFDPNQFSLISVYGYAYLLWFYFNNKYSKIIFIILSMVTIFLVAYSRSLTGMLCYILVFFFYIYYKYGLLWATFNFAFGIITFIYIILEYLLPESFSLKLLSNIGFLFLNSDVNYVSSVSRLDSMRTITESSLELFGKGLLSSDRLATKPHNWFLVVIYEQGIAGIILTFAYFLTACARLFKNNIPRDFVFFRNVSLTIAFINMLFFPNITDFVPFAIIGFIFILLGDMFFNEARVYN
jgi:hypothetical protein